MNKYKFIADPGHGWLEVPIKELIELGIVEKISPYSYIKGEFAYLEEDCDATEFAKAKGWSNKEVSDSMELVDLNHLSDIRYYQRYNPRIINAMK